MAIQENQNAAALIQRREAAVPRAIAVKSQVHVQRAEGSELWDVEGRRYIDFGAGIGVLNLGHRHPAVVAAIRQQTEAYLHTCFHAVPYEPYIRLAERLNHLAPGANPKKTALFNSGAEAVENAIKVARMHTGKSNVIAFADGFHGRTFMALTLTGKTTPFKPGVSPLMPGVFHVPYPKRNFAPAKDSSRGHNEYNGVTSADSLGAIDELLATSLPSDQLAAIILEPVQGEGGFNIAPPEFMQGLRDLCDRHQALLIADEVQSGFGRTGKMFAVEHSGVVPDLIAVAKSMGGGLPISALIGDADIMDAPPVASLGSTYGGNPLSCAAAHAVLDAMAEENLLQRSVELGTRLHTALVGLQADPVNGIADVRNLGAMIALEFFVPERVTQVIADARKRGLLLLSAGRHGQVIRLLPPLTTPFELVDEAVQILTQSIQQNS